MNAYRIDFVANTITITAAFAKAMKNNISKACQITTHLCIWMAIPRNRLCMPSVIK